MLHVGGLELLGRRAAQLRAHARQQLGEPERLGDVVVGAGVEPADGVHLAVLRGQEHDRHRRALLAHALAHLEPVDAGQPDVEHQQVVLAVDAGRDRVRCPSRTPSTS